METSIKAALVAFALATGTLALSPAMAADVTVGVGAGGIAFGYNDGYWDQGHKWHTWTNADESSRWRAANATHYYAWKHDRDPGAGWRETDRYWEHR